MVEKTALRWPPQPSTVVGLGILAGTLCYLVTGDPVWAGAVAAAVKILVPDNSAGADQVFETIETLSQAIGRPLRASAQQAPVASGDPGVNPGSLGREPPEK